MSCGQDGLVIYRWGEQTKWSDDTSKLARPHSGGGWRRPLSGGGSSVAAPSGSSWPLTQSAAPAPPWLGPCSARRQQPTQTEAQPLPAVRCAGALAAAAGAGSRIKQQLGYSRCAAAWPPGRSQMRCCSTAAAGCEQNATAVAEGSRKAAAERKRQGAPVPDTPEHLRCRPDAQRGLEGAAPRCSGKPKKEQHPAMVWSAAAMRGHQGRTKRQLAC